MNTMYAVKRVSDGALFNGYNNQYPKNKPKFALPIAGTIQLTVFTALHDALEVKETVEDNCNVIVLVHSGG